ncbi:MAG: hypothetical protein JWQ29_983 [Phenylobacterium sp.]|nr:hypothetical protein [Phenylobacterium sp.]
MRPMRLGLLAALIVAVMAPATAMAQRLPASGGGAKVAPSTISAQSRKDGMKDAPAIVQAAGATCAVSDARLAGSVAADKKAGTLGGKVYEVACGEGSVGFVAVANAAGPPTLLSCVLSNYPSDMPAAAPNPCILPTNADLGPALIALAKKAKVPCAPDRIRGLGANATNTFYEVSCPDGAGYVVVGASSPLDVNKPATAANCLTYDATDSALKCKLNEPAKRLAAADHFATLANKCVPKDRRYIGLLTDNTEGYEFACTDGKGYIYKINAAGAVADTLDCAKVSSGNCTLTDTRAATAEQASLYSRLAKNAGSSCQVAKYAIFPTSGDKEVVELVCGDGNGAIGMFPATGKGMVLDCGHALVAGYKCSLGKADYAGLTADLRKFDKKECTVSSVGSPLKAANGGIHLEVACSDGLPGYMIEFTDPQTPKEVQACTFSASCVLPTNKPKAKG